MGIVEPLVFILAMMVGTFAALYSVIVIVHTFRPRRAMRRATTYHTRRDRR